MTHHVEHSGRSCAVVPPFLLENLVARGESDVAEMARRTLSHDGEIRQARTGRRPTRGPETATSPEAEPNPRRTISDAGGSRSLPGRTVRREGDPASGDPAVDEAYDGLGATWTCLHTAYGRDSVDGLGQPLLASVHYGQRYDNAFWDGTQMVFGDGDGRYFHRFTVSIDVIGHELTHGVTEHTAGLMYQGEPGALNESVSDVFGSLVRQWVLGQTADEADWLIGAELFTDAVNGEALRSMKAPGTAYDDPVLGKDPQPATMDDYVVTSADNGGVHTNSGIPNHAFYLAATAIGGYAWEGAGAVWYDTLTGDIQPDCDFESFALLTVAAAESRFGSAAPAVDAVRSAWERVGVLQPAVPPPPAPAPDAPQPNGVPVGEAPGAGFPPSGHDGAIPADPSDWTLVTPPPPPESQVVVIRTGGLAGMRREASVTLAHLPDAEAREWAQVLASREIRAIGEMESLRPDAFSYRVCCRSAGVDVDLPEPHLPDRVIGLLERTLDRREP